jgi:hypothetical protein
MNIKKKHLMILASIAVFVVFLGVNGCKKSDNAGAKSGAVYAASVELCTDCGQIKGSEMCCKPDQTMCEGCGLVKGSPGCCKIPKDAETAAICTDCGQIKGSESCCKPDQVKCESCGLVKGSPGCCKLPKQEI